MTRQVFIRGAIRIGFLSFIGISTIIDTESSFSQGLHQAHAMCRDLVNAKGLKGDDWKKEYQKCTTDPQHYK